MCTVISPQVMSQLSSNRAAAVDDVERLFASLRATLAERETALRARVDALAGRKLDALRSVEMAVCVSQRESIGSLITHEKSSLRCKRSTTRPRSARSATRWSRTARTLSERSVARAVFTHACPMGDAVFTVGRRGNNMGVVPSLSPRQVELARAYLSLDGHVFGDAEVLHCNALQCTAM